MIEQPQGDVIVVVRLVDHGTHIEARLQNWRLLKPGDKYLKREDGNMKMVEKVEKAY